MFEHLNLRTRGIVAALTRGRSVPLGGGTMGPLTSATAQALYVLAANLESLSEHKGVRLAQAFAKLFAETKLPEPAEPASPVPAPESRVPWRLGIVRALSFRGLAPSGRTWQFDFGGKAHLLYGPNGCGKSSLLGAIAWCLTGNMFRDDAPPGPAESVPAFTAVAQPVTAGARPVALALLDQSGNITPTEAPYSVDVQLLFEEPEKTPQQLWIRRDSATGLATSPDGTSWSPIQSLGDTGILELDAELQLLLPARVPNLRFGKNPSIVQLFAQIVGLDELELITTVGGKTKTELTKEAHRIERRELKEEEQRITEALGAIQEDATEAIKQMGEYGAAVGTGRHLKDVGLFGKRLLGMIDQWNKQLASDLGLDIPPEDSPGYPTFKKELELLSKRVQGAVDALEGSLGDIFATSLGMELRSGADLESVQEGLRRFEQRARTQVADRLNWAIREAEDTRSSLMLEAAGQFSEGSQSCPVCGQDLTPVPDVRTRLEELRPLVGHAHLRKDIDDLELGLLKELDAVLPAGERAEAGKPLSDRVASDWQDLKRSRFVGLVGLIADRFDEPIAAIASSVGPEPLPERSPVAGALGERFPDTFVRLDTELTASLRYVQLAKSISDHLDELRRQLIGVLTAKARDDEPEPLLLVLQRGASANEELRSLRRVHKAAQDLWKHQKRRDAHLESVETYRKLGETLVPVKALEKAARQEVIDVVRGVDQEIKTYYSDLYSDEMLVLELMTPGHAANPGIRNELNVYLRAGGQLVPMEPFSNAGRLRALGLSFVFALLERASGSLGFVVLDDPALSLDDDHKARFVDRLVSPTLKDKQVILATHYENFYKVAEPIFADAERVQFPPRRTAYDAVSPEPGDLLQRIERSLAAADCSWREFGNNLRRWAERTLHTLSGYCPEPFVIFNNIPGSIDAYERISDPRIATDRRGQILAVLRSPEFRRVMHRLAHDEEPTRSEVEDALKVLKQCHKEHVKPEIERLKALYRHDLLARGIGCAVVLSVLSLPHPLATTELPIVGRAAAARQGVGVEWAEYAAIELCGHQCGLVMRDTLAPIALPGQFVLLDPADTLPAKADLVLAETDAGHRYARRFWKHDGVICLEGANPTSPYEPVELESGECKVRRIVGVLFDGPRTRVSGHVGAEWGPTSGPRASAVADLKGIRVEGNSMEPIARSGQIVLVHEADTVSSIAPGTLACVDLEDGAVIKRCYPSTDEWMLCPVNPTDRLDPMRVRASNIRHVYALAGVIFEVKSEAD